VDAIGKERNGTSGDSLVRDYPLLYETLRKVSRALAETLGDSCEVVVHDLHDPKSSVAHIENGHVTGRKVGDGIRDMAAILRSDRFGDDMLSNYLTRTPDGKLCKSATIVIRNEEREIVGAFAVNFDVGKFLSVRAVIDEFVKGHELDPPSDEKAIEDDNVVGILQHIIRKTIEEAGLPVSEMSRQDKVRIVAFLNDKEVFLIKGAVDYVAKTLGVSRFTVYNYLEEVRSGRFDVQGNA
jgi:predicted transcriptional regulator YheO